MTTYPKYKPSVVEWMGYSSINGGEEIEMRIMLFINVIISYVLKKGANLKKPMIITAFLPNNWQIGPIGRKLIK